MFKLRFAIVDKKTIGDLVPDLPFSQSAGIRFLLVPVAERGGVLTSYYYYRLGPYSSSIG